MSRLSLLLVAIAAPLSSAQQLFLQPPGYVAAPSPLKPAIADFTSDGKNDVVLAHSDAFGSISVLRGTGTGTFDAQFWTVTSIIAETQLAIGDVQGDGNVDVVVGSENPIGTFSLLTGNGNGAFGAPLVTVLPLLVFARVVAFGDLNGDGKDEILVGRDGSSPGLSVYSGPSVTITGGMMLPPGFLRIATADLDHDGDLDLIFLHGDEGATGIVRVALGNGVGGLTLGASAAAAGVTAVDMAVGDFDQDGNADVAVTSSQVPALKVVRGDGAGGWGASSEHFGLLAQGFPAIGDANGDGLADVVVAGRGTLALYAGDGTGALQNPRAWCAGTDIRGVAMGKLDGDGLDDLVLVDDLSGVVRVLPGGPTSAWALDRAYPAVALTRGIECGDLDQDGKLDVVSVGGFTIDVFLGDGAGGLRQPTAYVGFPVSEVVKLGDLDGDGRLDAVIGTASAVLYTAYGSPGGGFGAPLFLPATGNYHDVALGDVNGDGRLDIAATNNGASTVGVHLGAPEGGFASPILVQSGSAGPGGIALGDATGDGKLDFVVSHPAQNRVAFFAGDGTGGFAPPQFHTTGQSPSGVSFGDLNEDGFSDAVVCVHDISEVAILKGAGPGGLLPPTSYVAHTGVRRASLADLDGSGTLDVIAWSDVIAFGPTISVFEGDGAGGLARPDSYVGGGTGRAGAVGDLDSDGRPDLVFAIDAGTVSVLRNRLGSPAGVSSFGAGTPGCFGKLGLTTNLPPKVGESAFAVLATNAPRKALGLLLATNSPLFGGADPFGLGLTLHLDLFGATEIYVFDMRSDEGGVGFTPDPLPNVASFGGLSYFKQVLFVEAPGYGCTPQSFHLVSSKGLTMTIAP